MGRLHEALAAWCAANPHLREGQTMEDYWDELLDAYDRVRVPLGAEGVLDVAWTLARTTPPPPEAAKYGESHGALAAWCREIQRHHGARPFYLSARTVQIRLGLSVPMLAWHRLKALVRLGILAEVEAGDRHLASSFRYLLPM